MHLPETAGEDPGQGVPMKPFTVTGLCRCGCDDSFVEHTEAQNADSAARKALKERGRPGDVVAVFDGHLQSKMTLSLISEVDQ